MNRKLKLMIHEYRVFNIKETVYRNLNCHIVGTLRLITMIKESDKYMAGQGILTSAQSTRNNLDYAGHSMIYKISSTNECSNIT